MPAPTNPYRPYADVHKETKGAGDARPTAIQVIKDCDMMGKLTGKTILITGCSSGIGIETARALYEAGAKLLLPARDIPKLEKAIDYILSKAEYNKSGSRPEAIEMNLDSLESVRKGAAVAREKSGGKLDMLILNAGVMATPYGKTKDGFETQIGVNHFAQFLLFQLLKPLLLEAAKESGTSSRVVVLSSAGHRMSSIRFDDMFWDKDPSSYNKFQAYGQSKTANIYFANSITRHYGKQNLLAWSVHPGAIMTELPRHMNEEDFAGFGDLSKIEHMWKSPEQGAATTVWAAVSPHFEEGQNGGRYLAEVAEADLAEAGVQFAGDGYSAYAYDEEAEEKLWKLSCEAVGVPDDD